MDFAIKFILIKPKNRDSLANKKFHFPQISSAVANCTERLKVMSIRAQGISIFIQSDNMSTAHSRNMFTVVAMKKKKNDICFPLDLCVGNRRIPMHKIRRKRNFIVLGRSKPSWCIIKMKSHRQ